MRTSLVLTVIGDDKPGIVEQLSERVLATGANWEESRMARLAGKFAGLLRVSVATDQADALAATLRELDAGGLSVVVARSGEGTTGAQRTVGLDLIGHDHPGIVRDISRALAQLGVNIEDLEIAHSAEGDRGVLIVVIDAKASDLLRGAFLARGYRPSVQPLLS